MAINKTHRTTINLKTNRHRSFITLKNDKYAKDEFEFENINQNTTHQRAIRTQNPIKPVLVCSV